MSRNIFRGYQSLADAFAQYVSLAICLLLALAPSCRCSRWTHADELANPSTRMRGGGGSSEWPIDCRVAERNCNQDADCSREWISFKRTCFVPRFSNEEACDECRLSAINLSDYDTGFDLLKCSCGTDSKCAQQRRVIDECLDEMIF